MSDVGMASVSTSVRTEDCEPTKTKIQGEDIQVTVVEIMRWENTDWLTHRGRDAVKMNIDRRMSGHG